MLMEIEEETLLRTRDGAACSGVQQRSHCQRGKTKGCQGKIPNTKWLLAGVCNGLVVKQKMCNRRSPVFRTMVQTMEWVSSDILPHHKILRPPPPWLPLGHPLGLAMLTSGAGGRVCSRSDRGWLPSRLLLKELQQGRTPFCPLGAGVAWPVCS